MEKIQDLFPLAVGFLITQTQDIREEFYRQIAEDLAARVRDSDTPIDDAIAQIAADDVAFLAGALRDALTG